MSDITADFIAVTKKIVAELRGILTTLHLIRDDVKVIRDQMESESNKQDPNRKANDSRAQPGNGMAARRNVVDDNLASHKHDEGEPKTRRHFQTFKENFWKYITKPKTYVGVVALVFLVLYTCETRKTNKLTETATNINKASLVTAQRAWIGPKAVPFVTRDSTGAPIRVGQVLRNYGPSPALNLGIGPTPVEVVALGSSIDPVI